MGSRINFYRSVLASNLGPLEHPYKLNFCVTYQCQSRCLTCNIWQMRPKNELTLREIERFSIRNPWFRWVQLTGGEPFLRPDLYSIARAFYLDSHPYILNIPTNCLCSFEQTTATIRKLLQLAIPHIVITPSLDGPEKVHDNVRGIPGNYEKVKRLITWLTGERVKVIVSYTMSKYNQGRLAETMDQFPGIPFHVNLAQNSSNYYHNEEDGIAPDPASVASELSQMPREGGLFGRLERRFQRHLLEFQKTGRSPIPSRELDASLYLDSFGQVYPSVMWDLKLGNIRDNDYRLQPILLNHALAVKAGFDYTDYRYHWTSCEAYQTMLGDLKGFL